MTDDKIDAGEGDEGRHKPPDWFDDVESHPIIVNVYNEDGELNNVYYTVVIEDKSFDNAYIVSDLVEAVDEEVTETDQEKD